MTTLETDLEDEEQAAQTDTPEIKRIPPTGSKVSRFGGTGISKFGKSPSGSANPQLKQRPGRAAARGR